jgi:hypothetical protein
MMFSLVGIGKHMQSWTYCDRTRMDKGGAESMWRRNHRGKEADSDRYASI